MKQTIKEAGYTYVRYIASHKAHLLKDVDTRNLELWVANKGHASYGLIYKNTRLEFVSSYTPHYVTSIEQCKQVLES